MKSALLTGPQTMQVLETPDPVLHRDGDVLLRMQRVGVCGSDVHYYACGRIGSQIVDYPFCVGHECAAVVEAVGASVARVTCGDLVAVDPAQSCGLCDQCRGGRPHTCRHLLFLGTPGQGPGCLSERRIMPQECCFPVLPDTGPDRAALIEPLSIGVYAARLAGTTLPGKRLAILGAGPIGLSVLLALRAMGAESVGMTDKLEGRLQTAMDAGASWTQRADQPNAIGAIARHEPGLLDVVWECCGQQEALDQAVALLKPGGILVLVGIPAVERISFPVDEMRRKEIRLQNVRRQNGCVQAALDLVEQQGVNPDFMVTHHYPLGQVQAAFDLVHTYADGVIKAMITFEST